MKTKIINKQQPIGVFDSGIGGLSVVKEIIKQLPYENIVYLGDTARVPYGTKSKQTIIRYSIENTEFLIKQNIKLLVIACNTSSSYAVDTLKKKFKNLKIIEVITPGAKAAVELTKKNKIGVIGTKATIKSNSYVKAIHKFSKEIKVFQRATPLFVPLIEEGWVDKVLADEKDIYTKINHEHILKQVAIEYLMPLKKADVDVLILGCTHYPAIKNVIQEIMGKNVVVIDSSQEVAKTVKQVLTEEKILNKENKKTYYKFFVTDDVESFRNIGSILLDRKIEYVKKVNLQS